MNVSEKKPSVKLINTRGLARVDRTEYKWIFEEVKDETRKKEIIRLKSRNFHEKCVRESTIDDHDPFDDVARFFELIGTYEGKKYTSKCIRVVNKRSLGILPTELSLLSLEELKAFYNRYSKVKDTGFNWQVSTMDDRGRKNLIEILKLYERSKTVYEVGGLSCVDSNISSSLALMIAIGRIGYKEEWDLVIQTQHPRHAFGYMCISFPYEKIAGNTQHYRDDQCRLRPGYKDHTGRPAMTMALKGYCFREAFKEHVLPTLDNKFIFK